MHQILAEAISEFSRGIGQSSRPDDRARASNYLSILAPLLADAVLGRDILGDLEIVDQHFGSTSFLDPAPFEDALERWEAFKEQYVTYYLSSMTVNERLSALSLIDAYESAQRDADHDAMKGILQKVRVPEDDIERILNPPK